MIKERAGETRDLPRAILGTLGWFAAGGKSPLSTPGFGAQFRRAQTCNSCSDVEQLRRELSQRDEIIGDLRNELKVATLADEETCWSRDDKKVADFVKENLVTSDGRYEIPLPLKNDPDLPNNFELARKRLESLKKRHWRTTSCGVFLWVVLLN